MKSDLLLELGCEDLPARYVLPLAQALRDGLTGGLSSRGITAGEVRIFATPRRIATTIESVATWQADQKIERFGPALTAALKDGLPTPAALGFAKSCGVGIEVLGQKDGKLHFAKTQPGRTTAELLPEIFVETLKSMDALVPKRMRWGAGEETFVRPVQWIACLFGDKAVPLNRFGLKADSKTYGHRFHAPKPIVLKSPADYEKKLKTAKVWADFDSRKAEIRKQIEAQAKQLKGTARITESLLEEVTALVEWPVAIAGRMEERFMQLPPEVIIATIEHNQRYFPVFAKDGKLLPYFITVSNIESKDVKQVIAGNERVVRPRLSDALFFWEQDRKKKLADFVLELDRVTFQKDLGSTGDKVRRVTKLAAHIAGQLKEDSVTVERAASLCKADLVSRMVFEFPELQGVMGAYYAKANGEAKGVSDAIHEHYLPTHAGGAIPSTRAGQIVALADKLDTLTGIFAIGQKPTASKDPFALRRSALGILRICIEGELDLDLEPTIRRAVELQPTIRASLKRAVEAVNVASELENELYEFLYDRLRNYQTESGTAIQLVGAVLAEQPTNPFDTTKRIDALKQFIKLPEALQLAAAHKRIRNILKQVGEGEHEVRPEHLHESQEKGLYEALKKLEGQVQAAAEKADYVGSLKLLAQLQQPVDAFFDKVMVMAPESELRANRIALLRQLDRLCRSVADISCLPG